MELALLLKVRATGNGGADVFYRITSNLVSRTSFNTDFAATEVDTRQINPTRFPLFFPEKHGFFLEDASIFEFAKRGESHGPPGQMGGGDLLPFWSTQSSKWMKIGENYNPALRFVPS